MKKNGFTLVEVLIVVALVSVISVSGYRIMRTFSSEAVQLSHAGTHYRKAEFDRLISALNDRLPQAWSYELTNGAGFATLTLIDAQQQAFARLAVTNFTVGTNTGYQYTLADLGTSYAAVAQRHTYGYTNRVANPCFTLQPAAIGFSSPLSWKPPVSWSIPPPLYFDAADDAFLGIFPAVSPEDLHDQIEEHRAGHTGLLQHDLCSYTWSPNKQAFR